MITIQKENKKVSLAKFDELLTNLNNSEQCCSNRPIYEVTYNLGTKWLVCNECLDLEEFRSGIQDKVRVLA